MIKSYGLRGLPDLFNRTESRREARRLTGSKTVPVLVTDECEVVSDSKKIVAWAREHAAGGGRGRDGDRRDLVSMDAESRAGPRRPQLAG